MRVQDKAEAEAVAKEIQEIGQASHVLMFDVNDREHIAEVLEQDIAKHGAFYGVVVNVGLTRDGAFPALTDDDWDQVVSTSLNGFYNVLKPLIMPMIRLKKVAYCDLVFCIRGLWGIVVKLIIVLISRVKSAN